MEGRKIIQVRRFAAEIGWQDLSDAVAVEAPLEIQLSWKEGGQRHHRALAVTMRTPGNDEDLCYGFLLTEGIIQGADQIVKCSRPKPRNPEAKDNVIIVHLDGDQPPDWTKLERNFYVTSSCGVCGKSSIEAVMCHLQDFPFPMEPRVDYRVITQLPDRLKTDQMLFQATGGLHGCGLFDREGNLLLLREDVGRHNAVDKVIGAMMRQNPSFGKACIGTVSGRASFELVQKFAMAEIPILVAVGAPSSLAVSLAEEAGMTLIGFAANNRFNIYCGQQRIY
jgi:FdhD protein